MVSGAAQVEPAGSIKPINRQSIHRICSGQVILDLATAIKELVENALDAGATNIEVRLREYGSALVEVADNGRGVPPADYQALTLKYHTSKITSFDDLTSVNTYGFRGEALSSLCAVSELSVVTRTAEQAAGMRLEYDHEGVLTTQSPAPRAVGTTVAVKNLFATLPVRHKEFMRNLKREFARAVAVLQAYALIATRARLIVTNQAGKGSQRSTVFTTAAPAPAYEAYAAAPAAGDSAGAGKGSTSLPGCMSAVLSSPAAASATARVQADLAALRDNVVAVFGGRVAESLEPLVLPEDTETGLRVVGWVSRAGCGLKGDGSRQFFFLNGRPVDLPKAARVLNDSFKSLSSPAHAASCRAMAVLAVSLAAEDVDVNVTPDKRRVFMAAEDRMVTLLQQALQALWEPSRCTFAVNQPLQGGPAGTSALVAAQGGVQRNAPRQQQRQLQLNVQRGPSLPAAAPGGDTVASGEDGNGDADGAAAGVDAEAVGRRRAAKRARVASATDDRSDHKAPLNAQPANADTAPSTDAVTYTGTGASAGRLAEAVTMPAAGPAPFRHPFLSMLSGFAGVSGKDSAARRPATGAPSAAAVRDSQPADDDPGSATTAGAGQEGEASGRRDERRRVMHAVGADAADEAQATAPTSRLGVAPCGEEEAATQPAPEPDLQEAPHVEADLDMHPSDAPVGADVEVLGGDGRVPSAQDGPAEGAGRRTRAGSRISRLGVSPNGSMLDGNAEDADMSEPDAGQPGAARALPRRGPVVEGSGGGEGCGGAVEAGGEAAPGGPSGGDEGCVSTVDGEDRHGAAQPAPAGPAGAAAAPVPVLRLEPGQLAALTAARVQYLEAQQERRRQEAGAMAAGDGGAGGGGVPGLRFTSSSLQAQEDAAADGGDEGAATGVTRAEREAAAERELERVFRKQQFREMRVLGQFNLGFILARHGADVFIVDQHAAAEKTTFERLQRTVVLTRQPLLVPMALPPGLLLPVDQLVIREHIDVFRRNGFDFVERRPDGCLVPLPGARGRGTGAGQQGQPTAQAGRAEAVEAGDAGPVATGSAAEQQRGAEELHSLADESEVVTGDGSVAAVPLDSAAQEGPGLGEDGGHVGDDAGGPDGGADQEPGGELLLSSVPVSRATGQLGMEDVVELVAMLRAGEGPGGGRGGGGEGVLPPEPGGTAARQRAWEEELRPSRVRAMLASRACRSSIMVGRPLNRAEMRRLLDGLADLRQPWNCPHGRPTMRHVCVLPTQPGLQPA